MYGHRHTGSTSQSQLPPQQQPTPGISSARSSYIPSTQRYEEAAHHRSELETVKRDNEALRRRVRELERELSSRRNSSSGLSRRESSSTNASISRPGRRRVGEEDDDSVHVGESAGSVGVGGGQ